MATRNFFDHDTPEERSMSDRVEAADQRGNGYVGENIAAGNNTAQATVQRWMESPGGQEEQ